MKLRLSAEAWATVGDHAERGYPHEVCGILLGRRSPASAQGSGVAGESLEASEAQPCKNLNTERARDRYLLDPQDQLRIEKDARARGLDLLGYYHSHPDHPAEPSATDQELSWEGVAYLIVAVEHGSVAKAGAWWREGKALEAMALELP